MTATRSRRLLLAGNIILLLLLVAVCLHEGYLQRAYKRVFVPPPRPYQYTDNPHFHEEIDFGNLYQSHPSIVMLGNSLVQKIEWHELLGRCDVATRGVSGDMTDGVLARVKYVIALHPKIAFIEGGTNDIDLRRPVVEIAGNIRKTALQLKAAGIQPVLTAVTKVNAPYAKADEINRLVNNLNNLLHVFAKEQGFDIIDLNPQIAPEGKLEPAFARADGCHLTARAYKIWAEEIQRILKARDI